MKYPHLGRMGRFGFTLIELMIVISIIGILAAIAIPKFADLVRKAQEGATKGNLGTIRSALSIYYGDMEGQYPQPIAANDALSALTINSKYIAAIPMAKTPDYHPNSSTELDYGPAPYIPPNDSGGWAYGAAISGPTSGTVIVNCTHTDTKGSDWTSY